MHIRALTLETDQRTLLEHFYADVLGLPIVGKGTFLVGLSLLQFLERSNSFAKYHFAINIPENQIQDAIVWLEQRTPILLETSQKKVAYPDWDAHSVYFLDPVGNILELIARHELNNGSDAPFSAKSLLCISEIGLPVPNALEFAEWVGETLGISIYRNGDKSFTPLGNAHGLMVAVALGREWFPQTGVLVAAHYTRLEVVGEPYCVRYLDLPYEFKRVELG
jgi:catechol-2,3-dioxygenase